MHITPRSLLVSVMFLLLCGCASDPSKGTGPEVWYHPGVTNQATVNQQFAKCRMISNSGGAGLAGWNAGSLLATAMADGGRRKDVLRDCLLSEGWLRTRQSLVPAGTPFVKD